MLQYVYSKIYAAVRYERLIRIVPNMKYAKIQEKLNYTNSACNG